MKIGLVRSVFAAYEGWSLSKFIYGTPPEIIKIQNFLKKYSHLSPDYDFTLTDIYDLCQILPLNSDEYGIKVIKNSLYPIQENKNFLKTFQSLKNASLINVTNFPTMFDPHNSQIVSELFCNSLEENIVCEKEVFDEILRLIKNHGLRKHKIVNIIRFLDNRNLLTTELLSIIIEKCDRNCLHLLRGLFKAKCLDATNLNMILEDSYSYRRLNKFFKTLNNTHVVVNEHILKTLLNQKFYYDYITDILRLFVNYLNFDEDMLLTITQKHYMTEGQKFLVKTLIDHTLLNQSLLEFICKNHSDGFEQVVGILTDHQLLKPNEILLNEISNKNIPSAECASFLSFLDIQTLLNQEYIDLFLLNDKKSRTILTNVFQQLHASNIFLKQDEIKWLLTLSLKNLNRLMPIIQQLSENKLLNHESLMKTLEVITEKLPKPVEVQLAINNPVIKHADRTEIHFKNRDTLFIDQYIFKSGGQGNINKVYASIEEKKPQFGLKTFLKMEDLHYAVKEVQYNELMGRHAFYFIQNKKVKVVYEWQRENALQHFSIAKLLTQSLETRLYCLISGLRELSILHSHFRIHNDIKPHNIILDLENQTMKLIDFGGAHKKDATKGSVFGTFPYTPDYKDRHCWFDHFHKDVYSFGFIIMQLFPEIYTVTTEENREPNIIEQAIIQLVDCMMDAQLQQRCTSKDAFDYCQKILENIQHLDKPFLSNAANDILYRANKNTEDCYLRSM